MQIIPARPALFSSSASHFAIRRTNLNCRSATAFFVSEKVLPQGAWVRVTLYPHLVFPANCSLEACRHENFHLSMSRSTKKIIVYPRHNLSFQDSSNQLSKCDGVSDRDRL
eukprot:g25915.t1